MRDQEIRGLYEAYLDVYSSPQEVEELDENVQGAVDSALKKGAEFMKTNPVGKVVSGVLAPANPGRKTPTATSGGYRKEEVEELDEGPNYDRNRQKAAQRAAARNAARKEGKTGNVPGVGYVSPRPERETYRDSAGVERHTSGAMMPKKEDQKESFDLFDIILEHLVAEGYADTNENALVIMANMSEEWRQSIVEAYQEPRFGKKDYIKKLSKRGGMGMGTPEDPHGYRDPKMAKVGAEFSKRKTAAAKAKKTGEPDSYRVEKESQSKNR